MEHSRGEPVCAQEAIDLLNCVTESTMDESKCVSLLNSLRQCVVNKKVKKFSIANQEEQETKSGDKKA